MEIITAPNEILSKVAEPIKKIDAPLLEMIEKMKKTLLGTKDPQGVGLAAPQVSRSLQIFIAKPTDNAPFLVCINSRISILSKELVPLKRPKGSKKKPHKLEGCLSLPNIWGTVLRSPKVSVEYLDEQGKFHKRIFTGFLATIVQHEMDHLDGILFPKRVLEQKGKLFKSHKNAKGEDEFEEIEI